MVPIPCLEVVRCEADVCFWCVVFGCNCGLVDDFIHHTFTIQWAILSTVESGAPSGAIYAFQRSFL